MYIVKKNSIVSPITDAAGNTSTAYAGDRESGVDFFTGEALADPDEVISRILVCDRCGIPPRTKSELYRQNGLMVCKGCIDG